MSQDQAEKVLTRFRPWLAAAAIYNLLWAPSPLSSRMLFSVFYTYRRLTTYRSGKRWRCLYWSTLPPTDGQRGTLVPIGAHRHLILVGMMGKILGPIGFLWALASGQLPLRFGCDHSDERSAGASVEGGARTSRVTWRMEKCLKCRSQPFIFMPGDLCHKCERWSDPVQWNELSPCNL